MKNEKLLHTFESWRQEQELYSLMESADLLIEESKSEKSDISSFEDMTDDQIDEACEKEFNSLMEDKESIFDDIAFNVDEDAKDPYAAVSAAGDKARAMIDAETRAMDAFDKQSKALNAANQSRLTVSPEQMVKMGALAAVVGVTIGAGILLYKFIKKRREIKKALSGMEDGPNKDTLRKKYKAMSISELQQLNKIKMGKARVKGASDAAAGKEANTNQDPVVQSSYLEGYKEGQEKIKEIKAIDEMPKEERKEKIKELAKQLEPIKSAKGKIKAVANNLKDLKK